MNGSTMSHRLQRQSFSSTHQHVNRPKHIPARRHKIHVVAQHRPAVTAIAEPHTTTSSPQTSSLPSPLLTEQQTAWQECIQRLQGMGFSEVEAEQRVQRAFGWGAKARSYWRHEKVCLFAEISCNTRTSAGWSVHCSAMALP
eukprot:GHUV01016363.1.p1 GENE.GHUV01016363.1~~GHUV01016363.1.p1  ORF type:complete len:142 (+),score=21.29 GHUV01016363.1:330-755(+)